MEFINVYQNVLSSERNEERIGSKRGLSLCFVGCDYFHEEHCFFKFIFLEFLVKNFLTKKITFNWYLRVNEEKFP